MNYIKIKTHCAEDICRNLELSDLAKELLVQNPLSSAYLEALMTHELFIDAVYFLANALPKREATWWACLSARHVLKNIKQLDEIRAIELAEVWVYNPIEKNCKPTWDIANSLEFETAGSWAAVAAFWSGDNISPMPSLPVSPTNDLTAKAVVSAIMIAATSDTPKNINHNYQLFLRQGLDIAAGGDGRKVI